MAEKITRPAKRVLSAFLAFSMLFHNSVTVFAEEETISDETETELIEESEEGSEEEISIEGDVPEQDIEETEETTSDKEMAEPEALQDEQQELTEAEETAVPVYEQVPDADIENVGQASLTGAVIDSDGAGIAGVSVFAYDAEDRILESYYQTDSTGSWSVADLQLDHDYIISYYHRDYELSEDRFYITAGYTEELETVTGRKLNEGFTETDSSQFTIQTLNAIQAKITGYSGNAETVVIPAEIDGYEITEISSSVFQKHTELKEVVIPETVKTIGSYEFDGCTALENIWLSAGLETIGAYGFASNGILKEIRLPNTLKKIGDRAFINCTGLTEVKLPESVEEIAYRAFYGCTGLSEVNYPIAYTTGGTESFGNTSIRKIVIPEGVRKTANYAFDGCKTLEEVEFPTTLETVGNYSFSTTGIRKAELPAGVTAIGTYGFAVNSSLSEVSLPEGLKKIGDRAFVNCTGLTEVKLPESVEEIAYRAFYGCTDLSEINYPQNWVKGGEEIFNKTAVIRIEVPEGVEATATNAFDGAAQLSEVKLPSTLKIISNFTFEGCISMKEIEIPEGVEEIRQNAFYGCTALTEVHIPDSVRKMGYRAFGACKNLKKVNHPLSWKEAGGNTFWNTAVRRIEIPEGVTEIPASAYSDTGLLRYVIFPSTLTKIGDSAFSGCDHLVYVTIPQSIVKVGNYAFSGCTALRFAEFESYDVEIGYRAFYNVHPEFEITCPKYSNIVVYAALNNYRFTPIDVEKADSVIDHSSSLYSFNNTVRSNTGYIDLILEYAVKDSDFGNMISPCVEIVVNESLNVFDDTVYLNNVPVSGTFKDNILSVPVSEMTGTLRLTASQTSAERFFSAARLTWKENGASKSEIIDYIYNDQPTVSVAVPQNFSTDTIHVSGFAPSESTVSLYVNGAFSKSVIASKAGAYQTDLGIANPAEGTIYTITVKVPAEDGDITSSAVARYLAGTPEIQEFRMYYWNHDGSMYYNENYTDLTDPEALKKAITFNPRYGYRFLVKMTNASNVANVYVASTRNGTTKMLEAVYDAAAGAFVTNGKFDPDNSSYVPGTLSIVYAMKDGTTDFYGGISLDDESYFSEIPENLVGAEVAPATTVTEGGVTTTSTVVTLNDEQKTEIAVTYKEQTIVQNVSTLLANGYTEVRGADGTVGYVKVEIDKYTVKETVYDKARNKLIETVIKNNGGGELLDMWGFAEEGMIGELNCAMTYFEIQASNMSPAQKEAAMRQFYAMRDYYCSKLVVSYMFFAAGLICPELAIPLAFLKAAVDKTLLGYYNGQINGTSMSWNGIKSLFFENLFEVFKDKLKWIIDPSGTIYDGDTDTPLMGVTATVYYKDPETGEVSVWNADEYDQINPIITTSDGTFSWDVPEGLWQVKTEKAGYDTVYTEWLEVPPPQTGLIIRMYPNGEEVPVSALKLSQSELKLLPKEKKQLNVNVIPDNATDPSVTWTSSNPAIAAVDSSGLVTAVKTGTAVITATASNGIKAECTVTVTEGIIARSAALAMEGTLKINFYVTMPAEMEDSTYFRMTVGADTEGIVVHASEAGKDSSGRIRLTCPFFSTQMRDTVRLTAEDSDGHRKPMTTASGKDVTEGLEYSALTYIKNKENGSDAKLAALVKAMNNYGKYAQKYFNYGELDSEPDTVSLNAGDLSDYASQKSGSTEGLTLKSATLEFESGTSINVYYTLASGHNISEYTFRINGTEVTPVYNSSKKAYGVTVASVASNELQNMYEFTAVRRGTTETLTLRYGAYSFAYSKLSNSATAEALQNLMKAMYWYNQAAVAYFK